MKWNKHACISIDVQLSKMDCSYYIKTSQKLDWKNTYIAGVLCIFVADSVICALSKINVCVSVIFFVATNVAVWSNDKYLL